VFELSKNENKKEIIYQPGKENKSSEIAITNCLSSFEKIIGKQVIGTGGYIIGEVKGASINYKNWQIPELHVKLSSNAAVELGFKKRFGSSTVCIPTKMVQAVGDVITVSPPLKDLSENVEITECLV
jgi:sporulation protein YlmC with PRC-barrel domain